MEGLRDVDDSTLIELIVTLHIHRRATYKGGDREVAWDLKQESEIARLGFCLPPGPGEPGYEEMLADHESFRERMHHPDSTLGRILGFPIRYPDQAPS